MKKILITGGAGFIGSHLVDYLVKENEIIVVDNLSSGEIKNLPLFVKFYKVDIRDFISLKKIFEKEKPEFVFHLAANSDLRKSILDPKMDAENNIDGTINLLDLSIKYKIKKFIFSSSGAVYGNNSIPFKEDQIPNPISPYGLSKLTAEKYIKFYSKNHNLNYAILRYSNVYGPRQKKGVINIFLDKILKNEPLLIFGDGNSTRDYIYISDVIEASVLFLKEDLNGIYNISSNNETTLLEILDIINSLFNKDIQKKHTKEIEGEIKRSCLSNEKLKSLGWNPKIDLKEGITKTYEYLKKDSKS